MPLIVRMMNLMARARGMELVHVSRTPASLDNSNSLVVDAESSPPLPRRTVRLSARRNVPYSTPTLADGSQKHLRMDLLTPPGTGPFPAVVYISGGGFLVSARRAARRQRAYLASAGFVVASIDYRVVPDGATWRDGVADVRAAVRYLRTHAAELNVDPHRVGVWGESAGGYLSAMAALAPANHDLAEGDEVSDAVQACAVFFGAADLSNVAIGLDPEAQDAARRPGNAIAKYVAGPEGGAARADMPELIQQANPVTYATPHSPPVLIFHGDDDRIISPLQTQHLHAGLLELGARSTRYVVRNAGHGILGDHPRLWLTEAVMGPTTDFFREHLVLTVQP